jgi:hypothetical protein
MGFDEQEEDGSGGGGGLNPANTSAVELEGPAAEGEEEWGEEEYGWEDDTSGQQELEGPVAAGQAGPLEVPSGDPAAAAEPAQEAGADVAMLDAEGAAPQAAPPQASLVAAGTGDCAAQQAVTAQPAAAGGGLASTQALPQARISQQQQQQQQQQQTCHAGQDGGSREGPARVLSRPGPAGRKRQVVESDDEDASDSTAVTPRPAARPGSLRPLVAAAAGSGLTAAAVAGTGAAELSLAPLDDMLLKPPPSLVDLLPRPAAPAAPLPAAAPAAVGGSSTLGTAAAPQAVEPQLPSLPEQQPAPRPAAAAPAGSGMLCASGGKVPGGSCSLLNRGSVSGGVRPLQLRPSLRTGSSALAVQLATPRLALALAPSRLAEAMVVGDSDDDVPVFDGLVEDDVAAGAVSGMACSSRCSEEEPFTYLYLLAQRAKSAGGAASQLLPAAL